MKLSKYILICFSLLSLCLATAVKAQNTSIDESTPNGLIRSIVSDVMASIKADPEIQKGNVTRVVDLVEKKIVPHTDMRRTTEMSMGPNWKKATPEQQAQVTAEFKTLLIRTYAGALSQVRDQTVQYKALRAAPTDTEVVVRTVVLGRGDPIPLDYRLEKTPTGWKVYDLNVLGVWLVENYRNQFTNQINQNGIDGLIAFLKERNKMLAAARPGN
jgi:phospholipid transport system substrate-binding protein